MRKTAFLIISFILFWSSCVKEEFNPELLSTNITISPTVAVPIGYLEMTLEKYLANPAVPEQLTQDATGFFTLLYHQEVFSFNAEDVLALDGLLEDQSEFYNTSGFDLDLSLIPNDLVLTQTILMNLNFQNGSNARIDSALIENADILLDVTSMYSLSGDIQITIPQLTKSGVIYTKTTTINGFNNSAQLVDYKLSPIFRNDSNIIEIQIKATIKPSATIIPNNAEIVNYSIKLANLDYSIIYGYLGQQNINIAEQSISLPFFEKLLDGSFHFETPKLKLLFENSFGFPISIWFDKFDASTRENGTMTVDGSAFPLQANPLTIKFPTLQQVGQNIKDSLVLTPENTNLFNVLEALPTQIDFSVQATSNLNNAQYNFIIDTSKYKVDVQIELPLYGYASFLVIQDTLDFQFTDFYDPATQKIKKMSFALDFINSFPIEVDAQIYFIDENRILLDSMFDKPFTLQGGEDMDNDGKTDPSLSETTIVEIDSEKLERIKSTRYLLNKAMVHTTNSDASPPQNVKFYSDYSLKANLGAIFEMEELSTSSLNN